MGLTPAPWIATARDALGACRFASCVVAAVVAAAVNLCVSVPPACSDDEPGPIEAAEVKLGRPADFREDVLPVLRAKCLACHSQSKKEGGLVLESPASIRKGGDSGPALAPGKPNDSPLVLAAGRRGDVSAMPPLPNDASAAPLTPEELGRLRLWIQEGAKDSSSAAKSLNWQPLPAGIDAVYSLALDPSERLIAAGRANRIHLYDILRLRELAVLSDPALAVDAAAGPVAHRDVISSLAFSPDGEWLASGGYRVVKLWRQLDPLERRRQVESAVKQVAVSDDGRWTAAGLADGSVRIWDRSADSEPAMLSGHEAEVSGVTFPGDARRLISIAGPSLRFWDVMSGQQIGQFAMPSPARAILSLPDGQQFATGHDDGLIRVWSTDQLLGETPDQGETVAPLKELSGHSKPVTSLAWILAEAPRLLSGSEDGTLRQWDLEQLKETRQVAHGAAVSTVAATSDGSRMASAGADQVVRVWDAKGTKLAEFTGDPRPAADLAHRQDDHKVAQSRKSLADKAVADGEKDAKEREESLKKAREQVETAEKQVAEAAPKIAAAEQKLAEVAASLGELPDDEGRKKAKADAETALQKEQQARKKAEDAVASAKRGIELSEKSLATVQAELDSHKQRRDAEAAREQTAAAAVTAAQERTKTPAAAVRGIAFGPDGDWLSVADEAGRIVRWHVDSKRPLDVFETDGDAGITALIATAEGRLIVGTADGHVDVRRGEPVWTLAGHLGPADPAGLDVNESVLADRVLSIDFSPDGTQLATGSGVPSRSGQLLLWDLESRTVAREFADAHSDTVFDVAFSRDGTLLASGAADKFAKVFDVATGGLRQTFEGHTGHVLSVAWKADASLLATGGADNAIKAWTTATGEQQRTITSHRKPVTSVAFVGIEEKLISASGDQSVLMHTVSNGRNYRRLAGSTDFLHALVVSHDESRVIAGCEDGGVRLWDGTNGKLLHAFSSD